MEKDSNNQLIPVGSQPGTPMVDLLAPAERLTSVSKLYVRLHRHQLLLRKYWWILLLLLLVTIIPVYLLMAATPRTYQSHARMWLTGKLDLSEGRLYTEELVNFLGTQADLLRSRVVQERALLNIQKQRNNAPLEPVPSPIDVLRRFAGSSASATSADAPFPFKLKVTESSKSSLLDLQATGAEPNSTRLFLDAVMEEYLNFKRENRVRTSDRAVESLAGQVNTLAADLKAQQEKVYEFQMSNNVVLLQEQGNGAGSYLALVNRQLASLRTELQLLQSIHPEHWVELGTRSDFAPANEAPPGQAPAHELLAGLTGPQSDLLRAGQQIQLLEAKKEELAKALRPMHPKILKLEQDIAAQRKLLEVSRTEIEKQLRNRREALNLEIGNLENSFKEWDRKALDSSRKMVEYDRLREDVKRTQAAYDKLLAVISTVDVGKSVEQENVSVLESASAARPVRKFLKMIGLGFGLALFFGAGLFWVVGKFDDRFASQSELAEHVPEKIIGQVLDVPLPKQNGPMRREMLAAQRFEFLESFRSIRSALYFMGQNGDRPKTILVGSSVPQEGKSTVSLFLAATMAIGGSRVLLIDGDMRQAKLHRQFGVPSSPGLAEILNREATVERVLVPAAVENLSFLPAGAAGMEPGELVMRSQWNDLLAEVAPRFDYVIIDSPPVLAADDAATLAPRVDGVLFVVRGGFTSARVVRDALDTLRQRHARVLGLIFNRAKSSAFEDYPYKRYKDAYRWQPGTVTT